MCFFMWLDDAVGSFLIVLLCKESSCGEVLHGLSLECIGNVRSVCKNGNNWSVDRIFSIQLIS